MVRIPTNPPFSPGACLAEPGTGQLHHGCGGSVRFYKIWDLITITALILFATPEEAQAWAARTDVMATLPFKTGHPPPPGGGG